MSQDEVRDGQAPVNEKRRKLIKAVAVAGGAVAAAGALPGEWTKPLATVGSLPAHAQTSEAPIVLAALSVAPGLFDAARGDKPADFGIYFPCIGELTFEDPLCQVDDTATLWVDVGPCNGLLEFEQTLQQNGATFLSGDKCGGVIEFNFHACLSFANGPLLTNGSVAVQLKVGARQSNILNTSIEFLA